MDKNAGVALPADPPASSTHCTDDKYQRNLATCHIGGWDGAGGWSETRNPAPISLGRPRKNEPTSMPQFRLSTK